MGVITQKIIELGETDAGAARQGRGIGEIFRTAAHPRCQAFEQGGILVLAAIIKVGAAALAGAQADGQAFGLGAVRLRFRAWADAWDRRAGIMPVVRTPIRNLPSNLPLRAFSRLQEKGFGSVMDII